MIRHIRYALISVALLLIQTAGMRLLELEGVTPDILTIWVIIIALKEGQLPATIWGFAIGLLFDLVTGSFVGLSALAKTACGFIAGYFYNENKTRLTLGSYRLLLVVLLVSFLQNVIYFVVFTRGSDIPLLAAIVRFGATTTLYTAAFALFPVFVYSRRGPSHHV